MPRFSPAQCICVLSMCCNSVAVAQPKAAGDPSVPKELAPWSAWVLANDENAACPVRDDKALCFWPGTLTLALDDHGGRFAFSLLVDRRLTVRLPGGPGRWPLAVRVDGKAAALLSNDGTPSVELSAGEHRIDGRYGWSHLPESLPLPAQYGLIDLSLQGRATARPRRADDGSLWLQGEAAPQEEAQLELTVQRKLQDGVPMTLESRLRIHAAGQAREVDLGRVLPPTAAPMSIESELPARLDANGRLRLQVRAGSFSVRVVARLAGMPTKIENPPRPAPWPNEEIWVFQSDEALRQVQLRGARAIDPARVELDQDWRGLPTYALDRNEALTLETTRRGDPEPVPNQVELQRTLWLDQDGLGYSVHDQIRGEMHSGFRLDLHGFDLGRVAIGGRDQLITREDTLGPTGVELRDTALDLSADWRADGLFSTLPAVAWSTDVHSLAVKLNMPPGYALFAASGVDRVDRSWLQDWDLLGFFFVLLLALGTGRVAGIGFGLLAFAALGISYHEPDAPTFVWIALLVIVALLRAVPAGRVRTIGRGLLGASLLVLAMQAIPFAARSLREAIYPQLGQHEYAAPLRPPPMAADEDGARNEPAAPSGGATTRDSAGLGSESYAKRAGLAASALRVATPARPKAQPVDPDAVVQTGPGLPDWNWQSWQLSWSGPVQRDHHFELWIMPPRLTRSLALLRVLLCALLAYGLSRAGLGGPRPSKPSAVAAPLFGLFLLCVGSRAQAQFPEQSLLQELHARLTRPPDCRPNCVAVNDLQLSVDESGLRLRSEAHAQDRTSVRLPGPLTVWAPQSVKLDGAEAHAIALDDGFLHVRLTPGVHVIEARGPLPREDSLTLRLGDPAAHIRVEKHGYDVIGLREDGTADDSLELKRKLGENAAPSEEAVALPAWLTLTRELDLGLSFRVHTTLHRETPLGSAVVVHLPLLAGESVNDARIAIDNGEAIATLAPDDSELSFDSGLSQRNDLELTARADGPYSEIWRVRCSSVWRCKTEGSIPIAQTLQGEAVSLFRPWPHEKLTLHVAKPQPAEGQSSTIDSVRYTLSPGVRQTDASLQVSMRTSRGGAHVFHLPAGARVRSLTIDGAERPVHNSGRDLHVSLQPGAANVQVAFDLPSGMDALFHVPPLRLDGAIVNARVAVKLVSDRWLLFLHGPAWGPAILFWGYLAFALLVALLLSRITLSPLRGYEWMLLALGLTQIDALESLAIVAFFFLFALRARTTGLTALKHDLMQLGLLFTTLWAAVALFDAVEHGLLVQPDMQVSGGGYDGSQLQWYVDRTDGSLPEPTLLSAPLWLYRGLMLLWSLWLASRLLRWLPWAFRAFVAGGAWKRGPKRPAPAPPPWAAAPVAPTPPPSAAS